MHVIDESGRVFGVINVIDLLAVLLFVAIGLVVVGVATGQYQLTSPPPVATQEGCHL